MRPCVKQSKKKKKKKFTCTFLYCNNGGAISEEEGQKKEEEEEEFSLLAADGEGILPLGKSLQSFHEREAPKGRDYVHPLAYLTILHMGSLRLLHF